MSGTASHSLLSINATKPKLNVEEAKVQPQR